MSEETISIVGTVKISTKPDGTKDIVIIIDNPITFYEDTVSLVILVNGNPIGSWR